MFLIFICFLILYIINSVNLIIYPFKYSGGNSDIFISNFTNKSLTIISNKRENKLHVSLGDRLLKIVSINSKVNHIDSYEVRLKVQNFNLYLSPTYMESDYIDVSTICELYYRLQDAVSKDYKFICFIDVKDDVSNNFATIENCTFKLGIDYSNCMLNIRIDKRKIKLNEPVQVQASVYRCIRQYCTDSNKNNVLTLLGIRRVDIKLIGTTHLIWLRGIVNADIQFGVGWPRYPINCARFIEIPVKIKLSPIYSGTIELMHLEMNFSSSMQLQSMRPPEDACKLVLEEVDMESTQSTQVIMGITIAVEESHDKPISKHCLKSETIIIFAFKIQSINQFIDFSINPLQIKFKSHFPNSTMNINSSPLSIRIPVYTGSKSIFVALKNPIILASLTNQMLPFELTAANLAIFHKFGKAVQNITNSIHCRSLNTHLLKCPKIMTSFNTNIPIFNLSNAENPSQLNWSLELRSQNWYTIIDLEPEIKPTGQWTISTKPEEDFVLNKVGQWNIPLLSKKTAGSSQKLTCGALYQTSIVNIFQRIEMYDTNTRQSINIFIDLSSQLRSNNIEIQPKVADFNSFHNFRILQALKLGEFSLKLQNHDHHVLSEMSFIISNESVKVRDIRVECINDWIELTTQDRFHTDNFTVTYLQYQVDMGFKKGRDCFLIVWLIFSDGSEMDLNELPIELFQLRFLTRRLMIDVKDPADYWYNDDKFLGESSFHVELRESSLCDPPRVIFKKFVHLDKDLGTKNSVTKEIIKITKSKALTSKTNHKARSHINQSSISTSTLSTIVQSATISTSSQMILFSVHNKIILVLCSTSILALLIISLNILATCLFRRYKYSSSSSQSLNTHSSSSFCCCPPLKFSTAHRYSQNIDHRRQSHNLPLSEVEHPPLLPTLPMYTQSHMLPIQSPNSFWALDTSSLVNPSPTTMMPPLFSTRQFSFPSPSEPPSTSLSSSGFGTLKTHKYSTNITTPSTNNSNNNSNGIDNSPLIDPYDCKERYNQLSRIVPYSNNSKVEYGPI